MAEHQPHAQKQRKEFQNLMQLRDKCATEIIKLPTIMAALTDTLKKVQKNPQNDVQKCVEEIREKLKKFPDCDTIHDLAMKILYDKTHDHCMAIASLAALRSKDPHTAIGACIVDANNKVVGIGYNSMPRVKGEVDDKSFSDWNKKAPEGKPLEIKQNFVIHAAVNAIINSTIPDLHGCTIYLTQHPDEDCAHLIAQSGIKRVVYWHPYLDRGTRDHEKKAMIILLLAEVSVEKYQPKTEVKLTILRVSCDCANNKKDNEIKDLTLKSRLENSRKKRTISEETPQWRIEPKEFFMGLAQLECLYSNDMDKQADKKVGACIVNDSDEQVLAIGGSSGPRKGQETVDRLKKLIKSHGTSLHTSDTNSEHAEYTAISSYKGTQSLNGCTLYVTKMPCVECAKLVVQTGIKEIKLLCNEDPTNTEKKQQEISIEIFKKCKIFDQLDKHKMKQKLDLQIMEEAKADTVIKWISDVDVDVGKCKSNNNSLTQGEFLVWKVKAFLEQNNHKKKAYLSSITIWAQGNIDEGDIQINTEESWQKVLKGKGYYEEQYYQHVKQERHLIRVKNTLSDKLDNDIDIRVVFDLD